MYKSNAHNRQSIRLKDYDYTQNGVYYITICTKDRLSLFGKVKDTEMIFNEYGEIASKCWRDIPSHFLNLQCHMFVVMPNHVHGIIELGIHMNENEWYACRGTACRAPAIERFAKPVNGSIPTIVRSYKSVVAQKIHKAGYIGNIWQRNYYEHIIRSEDDYLCIAEYIKTNPLKWKEDQLWIE